VGLAGKRDRRPARLSGGEQQRGGGGESRLTPR
jgi:ABC-type ATPase involved in cell division